MNKNRYRVVYNKARQIFMAVAENVKSQTKNSGQSTASSTVEEQSQPFHQLWQVKCLVASMSLWMPLAPVYAQIQADNSANAGNRPVIGVGQNSQGQNVPVVNIQTPTNGVSHNIYKQMDVLPEGVVLNNSRTGANSALVGTVGANPFLAQGEARIILNEVNSNVASRFEGNLEVAGQRADVIIANPAGINIQGGGFINANKAILTTGKPQLNADGSIQQFIVDQGKITVSAKSGSSLGLGGNNNNADYVDVYARALELNAQLYANKDIQAITGANNISVDSKEIVTQKNITNATAFALDVKALGGMYANNIYIVGTDKGLGVNNAGVIQSSKDIVITNNGRIQNLATISTTNTLDGLISLNTNDGADILSTGNLKSNGNIFLNSGQNISIDNGKLIKENSDREGKISIYAKGAVNLKNNSDINNKAGGVYIEARNININQGASVSSDNDVDLYALNSVNIQNSPKIYGRKGLSIISENKSEISNTTLMTSENNNINITDLNKGRVYPISINGEAGTKLSIKDENNKIIATAILDKYGNARVDVRTKSPVIFANLTDAAGNVSPDNRVEIGTIQPDMLLTNVNFQMNYSNTEGRGNLNLTSNEGISLNQININNNGLGLVNAQANSDIKWQNTNDISVLTGKLDLRSNKKIDITGTKFTANQDINLLGKELVINSQLKANKDLNLTATENNLNLNLGTNLFSVGDINISALKGEVNSYDLKATSENGRFLLSSFGNTNLLKNNPFVGYPADFIPVILNAVKIEAKNDIVIGTIGSGNTKIESANISSADAGIKIQSEGNLQIDDSKFDVKGNVEFFSKEDLILKGISSNSKSHTAIKSNKNILVDTSSNKNWITKDLTYVPTTAFDNTGTKYSQINSAGVLSLISNFNQNLNNSNFVGGAILIESGGKINSFQSGDLKPVQTFLFNSSGSDFLKNNLNLKSINGKLSLNTTSDLTINAVDNYGRSFDYNEIKPIFISTGLMDIKASGILTLNGKTPPKNNNKYQQLMVDPATLKSTGGINLNAESINLNAALLINTSAENPINLISTGGDIALNVVKQNEINQKQYDLNRPIQNYRDTLIASGKTDNTTKNLIESADKEVGFYLADLNGSRYIGTKIASESDINIISKSGTLLRSADIQSKSNINIEAQGLLNKALTATNIEDQIDASVVIDGTINFFKRGLESDSNYMERTLINNTLIKSDKNINIKSTGNSGEISWLGNSNLSNNYTQAELKPIELKKFINNAKDNILINSADIVSKGDINIRSNGNIVMESSVEESYDKSTTQYIKESWLGLKKTTKVVQEQKQLATAVPTILTASNINLKARGDVELYSTLMKADGEKVDITGENLYFFTSKKLEKYNSDSKSSSSFLGVKYDTTKINTNRISVSQLPVKLQGDYLATDSNNDTVFIGTQFDYLKDATIKANGDIVLLGASNIIENSKTSEKNSLVWQKMEGEGSTTQTLTLPSFNGPTPPVFKAGGGLIVQIPIGEKDKNKIEIRDQILILANQPGNEYLKQLVNRNDVDWQKVILTQKDWDYKSQGLTAAGAAIIAIIVAIATSGAGATLLGTTTSVSSATTITVGGAQVALAAGGSITTFGGTILGYTAASGAATVFTTSGLMINAAFTAIASQASVGLINNQGDISKTLQQLGSKDSIKSLATSVITVGILDKIGGTAWMSQFNDAGITGRLITGTVNSAGTALVTTTINGGNLSENIENALLFNLANVLQGTLASEIKVLEETNYILHKIAHAAAGCMAATIAKSDCEAGAIGAAIGEMAADLVPTSTPIEQMTAAEREEYNRKVLSTTQLVAGGIAGLGGYDVNTAVQTANIAITNNYLTSQQFKNLKGELDACSTNECKTKIYFKYQTISNSNDNSLRQACAGINFNEAVCSTKINELLIGQNTAKSLRLYSEYISFNQFGKFDPQIQQKAQAVAGIHYLKNWENNNCKGLTDAACGQKYIALKDSEKENFRKVLDHIESVPGYGTGILVGENIKVIATGLDFTDTEKSRLLALAETISLGVTKKLSHILNPVGSSISINKPLEKISKNSDGFNEVRPKTASQEAFDRLNIKDKATNEIKILEATAGAKLEPYIGKLKRLNPKYDSDGKPIATADFEVVQGPNSGKTVDMMFTNLTLKIDPKTGVVLDKQNEYFEKNLTTIQKGRSEPILQTQIKNHLQKADIVPMDLRVLSPSNQALLINYIKTLPKDQQAKIIIMR